MNTEPKICETCKYGLIKLNECTKHNTLLPKERVCDDYNHFKARYAYIPDE